MKKYSADMRAELLVVVFYPLLSAILCTSALRIEPPLALKVPRLRPVTFTWIREPGDPENFGFQKLGRVGLINVPSETFSVEGADRASGEFTLTFTAIVPYFVVAINLDASPSTFFTASNGPNLIHPVPSSTQGLGASNSGLGPGITSIPAPPTPFGWPSEPTETQAMPSTSTITPQKSVIIGAVVGLSGFILLLLIIVTFCRHHRLRVGSACVLNFPKFHRYRQSIGIRALSVSIPDTPFPSSVGQRQLLGISTQSPVLVAQAQQPRVLLPVSLPSSHLQHQIEDEDYSHGLTPPQADGTAASWSDLGEEVKRAVQGLQSQFSVIAQRVA
ncbi:hypothetical protein PM082_018635 [Marasmius tenuissimus]|nr:hypothetical protein PM082_018635 [Marasmius tenuissimus]